MAQKPKRFTLTLRAELAAQVDKARADDERTLQSWVVKAIQEKLERKPHERR